MKLRLGILSLSVALCATAHANPIPENDISVIRPQNTSRHQAEQAQPTKLPWCTGGKLPAEHWESGRIHRAIDSHEAYEMWADAAERLCEHKEDPTWVRQATALVQVWMNGRENSQAEAEKEIADKIASLKVDRSPAGQEREQQKQFEFSADELGGMKPNDGVDAAKVTGTPAWCDVVKLDKSDYWDHHRISRTVDNRDGINGTIEGAAHLCQRGTDETWKAYTTKVLQKWMNWTHESQPDAEKSLRARVQSAKFAAERTALCKDLEVSPEVGGEERTFAVARRDFFGCEDTHDVVWQQQSRVNPTGVGFYIDAVANPDELMRAYWLLGYLGEPFDKELPAKDADANRPLLYYAIAQHDLAHLDYAAIDKMLSAAPYNDYARIVALETFAMLKAEQKVYDKALEKMTKGDDDYTAILRTAPKHAFDEWDKQYSQWKPEIERSNAFEKLLSKPSRKALKGCSTELVKDGEKIIKSFKSTDYKELVDKISADPVANLLLSRIAVCFAADQVWGGSGALRDLVTKGRSMRGPRTLAYYAVVDAIATAQKDRPRLLLDLANFHGTPTILSGGFEMPGKDLDFNGSAPREWEKSDQKGVVASTKKLDDGIQIVFKTVKLTWPDEVCTDDTRHPLRITDEGRVEYYQNCKATGKTSSQDITPNSIVISPLLAANVKPGVFLQFVEGGGKSKSGNPFAIVVWTKKASSDKKIASFFGFGL
jgi:hypothetical protein